jgi:LTXXQ motif family protein
LRAVVRSSSRHLSKEIDMKKILLAGVAAIAIAGSSLAYAQHHEWFRYARMSPEDRAAFADARIAAVKAGLKLTPDQEKLWPPVEAAARDFAKLRIDRAIARINAEKGDANDAQKPDDPVARLRARADRMATTAAALKRIADASDPLYKTLDEGQKRRLRFLTHFGHKGWGHHEADGDRDGDRGDRDRGYDHDGGGRDHGGRGSERL